VENIHYTEPYNDHTRKNGVRKLLNQGSVIPVTIVIALMVVIPVGLAISQYLLLKLRGKNSEIIAVLEYIATAEEEYFLRRGSYLQVHTYPNSGIVGKQVIFWDSSDTNNGFRGLGVHPQGGKTQCQYSVKVSPKGDAFTVLATCDVDGDDEKAYYAYFKPNLEGMVVLHDKCADGGVWVTTINPSDRKQETSIAIGKAGPCNQIFGKFVF